MKSFTMRESSWLMHRFNVQWLMLALMVCLVVACKGGRDGDDEEKHECILNRVTDKELNSFNPDIPLTKGSGQSEAFTMHPLEEMTISAPAGAFDQNPDIHVSVASGQQLQAAEDRLAELMPDHELLWGYDIDAGLPSDSVLPGKYTVKIDLNKLDIPEQLQYAIRIVRMDDKGNLLQLNSRVKDGIIRYEACQNSVVLTTILSGVLIGLTAWGVYDGSIGLPVRLKMSVHSDLMQVPVTDAFGNFNVLFRYSQTENGDRAKEYYAKNDELEKRLAVLEKQAKNDYDNEHPTKSYFQWMENPEEKRKRRVGREELFYKLVSADAEVKRLVQDPDIELPRSVLDVIKATRLANRFSRDTLGLGMKPLSYTYNVYLVPQSEMGKDEESTQAKFVPMMYWRNRLDSPIPIPKAVDQWGYILVSYDSYLKKAGDKYTYNPKNLDATCVTMAHEISHAFECEYVHCVWVTNTLFFEAIGSVTEHWFTAWMKKKGYIDIEDTESEDAMKRFEYADRDKKQLLAWPLQLEYPNKKKFMGVKIPEMWGGYMLGDLVQFLCDNKKKVSFNEIMTNYAYNKTFLQDLKDIFGIKSSSEFGELYTKFCFKFMPEIFKSQQGLSDKNLLKLHYKHTPTDCVVRLKDFGLNGTNKAYPFAVKVTQFATPIDNPPYSLVAVPSKKVYDHELMFTFLEGDSLQPTKESLFIAPCEKKYERRAQVAIIYREFARVPTFDNDYYIDIVALYQPKEPKVLGPTKDGTGINVHTGDKPAAKLLEDPKNPYVTGMQMVVINNKTGKKKIFNIPLEQCGQEVKIPLASIGITKAGDIDISLRTRWYYEKKYGKTYYSPATERVNYKKQKAQEEQIQTTEPEPSPGDEQTETNKEFDNVHGEDVSKDLGDAAMTKEFRLIDGSYGGYHYYYANPAYHPKDMPLLVVHATAKVEDGQFTITVPTHTYQTDFRAKTQVQGFTITGKYIVKRSYADAKYNRYPYDLIMLREGGLEMTPFVLTHTSEQWGTSHTNISVDASQFDDDRLAGRIYCVLNSENELQMCLNLNFEVQVQSERNGVPNTSTHKLLIAAAVE